MKIGGRFNFKAEKSAEEVMHNLVERRFDDAFKIADKFVRKKNKHPVFAFAKAIQFLVQGDEENFQARLNEIFNRPSLTHSDCYNFGVFFQNLGIEVFAIESFAKCVELKADYFEGYEQLGNSIYRISEYDSALGAYISALSLQPESFQLNLKAGDCCIHLGEYQKGLGYFEKLYNEKQADSDVRIGVARCLLGLGKLIEAENFILRGIEGASQKEKDYFILANIYKEGRDFEKSLKAAAEGYRINSSYLPLIKLYGSLLGRLNYLDKSIEVLKAAIARDPADAEILFNYGNAYQNSGRITEARKIFNKVLEADARSHKAINNLGFGYQAQGDHTRAKEYYRKALEIAPERDDYHSNILYSMLHEENVHPKEHYKEARKWNEKHGSHISGVGAKYNFDKGSDDKIRIGYVSADFGDHVVTHHWLPIVRHHDRSRYEIFLYSQRNLQDQLSAKINEEINLFCDQRRDISLMTDDEFCDVVRQDSINILVDLSGHTAGNRLTAFSMKPAPIQATYIGYPATTGVDAVDYFITQPIHTPLEAAEYFSEKLVHTPGCTGYSIRKGAENTVSKPLPFIRNGFVTFGSFNRPNKISTECISAWATILSNVPNSKMIIKGDDLIGSHFEGLVIKTMTDAGVSRDRLDLRDRSDYVTYLEEINEIDIGLDSFPFNGATTSFDMLFMGRAYVSFKDDSALQKLVGASYLEYLGRSELVANSIQEYTEIAIRSATEVEALEGKRLDLREAFLSQISGGGAEICASLEMAYQKMWDVYISGMEKDHILVG